MATRSEIVLEELENISRSAGHRMLERRLADLAIWFHNNKTRIDPQDLLRRQAFMEKALWTMVEVQALLLERIQELEQAKKGVSRLWLPAGMKVNGDTKFG